MRLEGRDLVDLLANPASVAVIGASSDPARSLRTTAALPDARWGTPDRCTRSTRVPTCPVSPRSGPCRISRSARSTSLWWRCRRASVVAALREAEAIGVRAAVVIGSGFEDRLGAPRQELDRFAAESELRLIGPNCVGTLGVAHASYLTFSSVLQQDVPKAGRIGLVTQSGALGNSLLQTLIRRHVGLASVVQHGQRGRCRRHRTHGRAPRAGRRRRGRSLPRRCYRCLVAGSARQRDPGVRQASLRPQGCS